MRFMEKNLKFAIFQNASHLCFRNVALPLILKEDSASKGEEVLSIKNGEILFLNEMTTHAKTADAVALN